MSTLFHKALLVEDEPNLASTLELALRKLAISSQHVSTLEDARLALGTSSPPDLILLDRTLPDGDGITLCTELRAADYVGAILMLTAAGQMEERVLGLNAGADDYLPKPFSWEELEARIRALARRFPFVPLPIPEPVPETKTDKLWQIDSTRLRILGHRGWKELTPLEYKLATSMIHMRGKIVSRDQLLKEVWGFTLLPRTRTVDHFLGRLRKYFEENPENPRHFLTIRGAGYRFED